MNELQKQSFVLFADLREPLEDLTDEQVGKLFRAVLDYVGDGTEPEFTGILKLAFAFMKTSLDRNMEKYKQTIERRRAAGRAGGLASAEARKKKAQEEVETVEQTQANSTIVDDRSPAQRLNHVPVHVPDSVRGPVPEPVPDSDPVRVCDSVRDPVGADEALDTDDKPNDEIRCEICGWLLTEGVAAYSMDKFRRHLCQKCQQKVQTKPILQGKPANYFGEHPKAETVKNAFQELFEEEQEPEPEENYDEEAIPY